ncbi:MAG: hypothetical protein LBT33_01085, partial [Spirochaetia bacterium]|nr:hypothetical protein [Spirochaetia bacterium]
MKKFVIMVLVAALALGACGFVMGPEEPAGGGEGNLSVSLGREGAPPAGKAITSGADLPPDVLAALRYELVLSGPGGEVLEKTVIGGQGLSLTAALGQWRIDARAFQQDVLAGTGSLAFAVGPGRNSVLVPMYMSGPCYTITPDPAMTHGTLRTNFTAAFPGTA